MLDSLAQIGEFLGGIGALVALVYLALQIRQSNEIARAQSRQTLRDTFYDRAWEAGADPRLARIFGTGVARWPDLPDEEKVAFTNLMTRWIANVEEGIDLRDNGLVDDGTLEFIAAAMAGCIRPDGGRRWWEEHGSRVIDPRVRAYIEQVRDDPAIDSTSFAELFPYWIALGEGPSSD